MQNLKTDHLCSIFHILMRHNGYNIIDDIILGLGYFVNKGFCIPEGFNTHISHQLLTTQ